MTDKTCDTPDDCEYMPWCKIRGACQKPFREPADAVLTLIAENERQRHEIASLHLTLGGKTFSATVPAPIGCPMPGACAQVAEIARLRTALAQAEATLKEKPNG